jgi:hypothetical protein
MNNVDGYRGRNRVGLVLARREQAHTKDYSHPTVERVFDGRIQTKDLAGSLSALLAFLCLPLPTAEASRANLKLSPRPNLKPRGREVGFEGDDPIDFLEARLWTVASRLISVSR